MPAKPPVVVLPDLEPDAAPEVDAHSSQAFLNGRQRLLARLQVELEQVNQDLASAELEADTWTKLHGTPGANDATKNRHITPHRDHWRTQVTRLKNRKAELETDLHSLALIGQ